MPVETGVRLGPYVVDYREQGVGSVFADTRDKKIGYRRGGSVLIQRMSQTECRTDGECWSG